MCALLHVKPHRVRGSKLPVALVVGPPVLHGCKHDKLEVMRTFYSTPDARRAQLMLLGFVLVLICWFDGFTEDLVPLSCPSFGDL